MTLSWGSLLLVCGAGSAAWFWHDSLAARERANQAAVEACARLQLQFLDGTVAFTALAVRRAADGWPHFERRYVFDYTADSIERRQGFVILAGRRLDAVGFAAGDGEPAGSVDHEHRRPSRHPAKGRFDTG